MAQTLFGLLALVLVALAVWFALVTPCEVRRRYAASIKTETVTITCRGIPALWR